MSEGVYMDELNITIKQRSLEISKDKIEEVFNTVKKWIDTLPLFNELGIDLVPLLSHARRYRTFQDVIVLGTGGSCLSGKMFANFKTTAGPRMHFIDNVDPYEWNKLFNEIDLSTTGVLSISKSGQTTETLCQTLMAVKKWSGLPHSEHFTFVADPGESAMREIAEYYGITCLDHPVGIGGRFSAFSIVGMLPALIAGVDAQGIVSGAKAMLKEFLDLGADASNNVIMSAFLQAGLFQKGVNISVLFCYANRLLLFAEWYRQLWSESLGKQAILKESEEEMAKRYGSTPVVALGTVDQHSQLQLYIDGPRDKFFTVLTVDDHPETDVIDLGGMTNPVSRSLNGHTMAELMKAHQQVVIQTLMESGCEVRNIHLKAFDEESLGELMMFSILETLALGSIWNVDPFNQPGVKSCKDRVISMMK